MDHALKFKHKKGDKFTTQKIFEEQYQHTLTDYVSINNKFEHSKKYTRYRMEHEKQFYFERFSNFDEIKI